MTTDKRFELVLSAAKRGDEWALAVLYRRLQPSLLGYLRSTRPYEAEDLASETWVSIARGLHRFSGGEDAFRRWVFTTARRRVLDSARRDSRRPATISDGSSSDGFGPQSADAETEVLDVLATREALDVVRSLPPREAEVILLRVLAGLSTQDVAAITGRSVVSVRVIQHRALRRLASVVSQTLVTVQGRLAL